MNINHPERAAWSLAFYFAGVATIIYVFLFAELSPWWMRYVVAFAGFGSGMLAADDYHWYKAYKKARPHE